MRANNKLEMAFLFLVAVFLTSKVLRSLLILRLIFFERFASLALL